ncbi:MAG: GAF domain-containing protein [Gemmatimonadales bacterium]
MPRAKGTAPRARRSTAPRARRQSALLRLAAEISAAHDERAVCEAVVRGLHDEALGYELVGLFLVDEATGDRVLQASVGWTDVAPGLRIPPGRGLTEQPLLTGELHYTPDVTKDPRYVHSSVRGGSEVDVPIRVDHRVEGVLIVQGRRRDAFGPHDFEILNAAALQAGIAIGRARLVDSERALLAAERRRADEQAALIQTMADLSAELELSKLLQAVLRRAVALLGVAGGELAIYDESKEELVVAANDTAGPSSTGARLKVGEGALGHVAQTREPLIIPDYRRWSGRSDRYANVEAHAAVVLPLLIGGRLVGAMNFWHADPARQFHDADLRLAGVFAPQAAIAIENARPGARGGPRARRDPPRPQTPEPAARRRRRAQDHGLRRCPPRRTQHHGHRGGAGRGHAVLHGPGAAARRARGRAQRSVRGGVVMYECLTGDLPFAAATAVSLIAKLLKDEPAAPPELNDEVPPALSALVLRLLAKRPEDRVQTAAELGRLLNELG